jgi:type VI secretion system protein ImpH
MSARRPSPPLDPVRREAFLAALASSPHRFDFYQTLRRLECLHPDKPRLGRAPRPVDEPIRLGQDPYLSFAPTSIAGLETRGGTVPRLQVWLFGLLGPNGPMPIHFTEYVRERLRHAGDATLSRFLDVFHHRFLMFLYQAWAQAQPHVNRDRPKSDRFVVYVGSFLGLSADAVRDRDQVPDAAKLFHAWALVRRVRNPEGLTAILQQFFRVPVRAREFIGHWMTLGPSERTYLGREGAWLGAGAVAGGRVWDRQHKFRLVLGPLTLRQYEGFLPGGVAIRQLVDWIRFYLSFEFEWDVQMQLRKEEVPALRLGAGQRLGWTTWLGTRQSDRDADELHLNAEAWCARVGAA